MKILLWAPLGAGTHYWGPGTNAYRLYKSLKNSSHEITLVHGSSEQELFPEVFKEQIKLPSFDKGYLNKALYFYEGKRWLQNNYKNYDVFHGISAFETTFYFARLFEDLGKPAFIKITGELGGFGGNSRLSNILGISKRRMKYANRISGYIAISSKIKKNLLQLGVDPKRIFSIPNGVDTSRFCPVTNEEKLKIRQSFQLVNRFTITYLGGLTENKRVYEIVLAINLLVKEGYNVQLLLIGPDRSNGIEYNKIRPYLNENIIHIPFTKEPEKYLQASDLYVLNSISEGMPNSLLEAMSSGLICLTTPASGSEDLVYDNVEGIILDGSSECLYNNIKEILIQPQNKKFLASNARQKIIKHFSTSIILEKHFEIFSANINEK